MLYTLNKVQAVGRGSLSGTFEQQTATTA